MKELREVLRSARPRQGSGVWAAYGRLRDAIYRDYGETGEQEAGMNVTEQVADNGLGRIQGVVFLLRDSQGRILMERCPKKKARHGADWFVPGGRVEDSDDSPSAALHREMREELDCVPMSYSALPIIDACGGSGWPHFLMQPYLVTVWLGTVPEACMDHPDVPLKWMDPAEAIHTPSAVVRALVAAAVPAIGWRVERV